MDPQIHRSVASDAAALLCFSLLAACTATAERGSSALTTSSAATSPAPAPVLARPAGPNCPAHPLHGDWYLNDGGNRWTLSLQPDADCALTGAASTDSGASYGKVTGLTASAAATTLAWTLETTTAAVAYSATITDGVLVGRSGPVVRANATSDRAAMPGHVSGWHATLIDGTSAIHSLDLTIGGTTYAALQWGPADKQGSAGKQGLAGRIKVYATATGAAAAEEPQYELTVDKWDGTQLVATALHGTVKWTYTLTVAGRTATGTLHRDDAGDVPIVGQRSAALAYGLAKRSSEDRAQWQTRTRRQLKLLTMAGGPKPAAVVAQPGLAELPPQQAWADTSWRDDAPQAHPATYHLNEWTLAATVAGVAQARSIHLWVATPPGPVPAGGWPVAIALNGHFGSAWQTFYPAGPYWYGDAFARRGYLVVAVDVGHRPVADRAPLYGDFATGDSPNNGNGTHPAVVAAASDSDWQEDGERTWDAMRALDWALAQPGARPDKATVVGLSLGGEVATWMAALDPRIDAAVVSGFAPDLNVLRYHNNHACWQWQHADIGEYLTVADLHALVAPRLLVVETGMADATFSAATAPFASDKQVVRQSRVAYGDDHERLWHYLHEGGHVWRAADGSATDDSKGITLPVAAAPKKGWLALLWQIDERTHVVPKTVFEVVAPHN